MGSGTLTATAAGAITVNGAVNAAGTASTNLTTTGGAANNIVLAANVGNATGNTVLTSVGDINPTAAGKIVAGANVTLDSANGVGNGGIRVATLAGTLAARSTASGKVFISPGGPVVLDSIGAVANGAAGGAAYDVSLGGGVLSVNGPVTSTGTVTLATTTAGQSIQQTASGVITAGTLETATNNAAVNLNVANNVVANLGVSTLGAGSLLFKNAANLTIAGAISNNGLIINNTGTLAVNNTINVGANNVFLNSTGGITQSAAGVITANSLGVTTTNANALLNVANNAVPNINLGGVNTGSGLFSFKTAGPLTVGGPVSAGGIDLAAGGALAINNSLTSTGNVALTTLGGGAITQTVQITSTGLTATAPGAPITLTNAANDFSGTVLLSNSGAFDVAINDLNAINLGATTVGNNFTVTAPGGVTLNGGVTSGGSQTYNNGVTLGTNLAVTGVNINFAGTVNGANALTVLDSGTTTFGGAVGGIVPLSSLTTNVGGATAINGGTVSTAGAQTYNDVVTLGANTTLSGVGITFGNTINGAKTLLVNDSGATTFGGIVGGTTPLTSLTTDAAGTSNSIGVTTTGATTFNDITTISGNYSNAGFTAAAPASLGGGATILNAGANAITFGGTLNGAQALTANSTGATTFAGVVGGVTPLASLTTNAGGTSSSVGVNTTGATLFGENTTLSGTYTNTGFTSSGNTTLAGATIINAGVNPITFTGFIDGAQSITANSSGITTFNAGIGGGTPLASLTTDPGGTTLVGGPITTAGPLTLNDVVGGTNLTLNAGAGAITAFNLANNFTGVTTLGGGTIQVANAGPMTAALTASGASTLTAGGNLLVSGSTVGLTTTTFGAGTTNFGATTVSGSLNTTSAGAVSQSGALLVSGNTDIHANTNPVTLTNAGNDFAGPATFTGGIVQVTDSNALFATLSASGSASLISGGNLTVSGSAAGLTATSGGTTTFGATNVGGALSVSSLSGAVTQTNGLVVTGNANINAGPNPITLTNSGNDFQGPLSLSNSGANNVAVTDANALVVGVWSLGTGTLIVNTNGAVTESGLITQAAGAGAASFNAAGPITLTNANNDFTGPLSLTGAATQVTDKNALTLGTLNTGALTVTSTGALNLGQGTVGGALIAKSNNNAITQTGALTVSGISDINAGNAPITLTNANNDFVGAVSVAGSTVQIADKNSLSLGNLAAGSLALSATNSVLQGALNTSGNFTLPSGTLTINPGGSLTTVAANIASGATLATGGSFTATGPVTVGGILKGSATGPIVASGQPVNVISGGTLDLNGGSITASAINNQGLLKGVGTINSNVFNDGTFSPGASPGLVNIVGNYVQGPTGLLNIEIGGTTPGTGFDKLDITGNATLNGVLTIVPFGNFVATPADSYRFLTTGGTISGTFSTIVVPTAFAGFSLNYQSQFTDALASPFTSSTPGAATNQLIAATKQNILVVEEDKKILTEEEKKKLGPTCAP